MNSKGKGKIWLLPLGLVIVIGVLLGYAAFSGAGIETDDAKQTASAAGFVQIALEQEQPDEEQENQAPEKPDETAGVDRFYYERLSEKERDWYLRIYEVLENMQEEADLQPMEDDRTAENGMTQGALLDKVFQCVINDHPELFFVSGYTYTLYFYGEELSRIRFSGMYTMSLSEREEKQAELDAAVSAVLQEIPEYLSEYEKVKRVYEWVIRETEYEKDAPDNQNICSVFLGRRSVCQGYAKAVQYLLEQLDVQAAMVFGTVYGGESHAWNLVKVDGNYYYVDATWGDASYRTPEEGEAPSGHEPSINYDYLCVTTAQLEKTHMPETVVAMPECTALEANYYVRENAYFTAYDTEKLADLFERGYEEEKKEITLKCENEEVYREFYGHLLDNQEIFDYMEDASGSVAYIENAEQLSLTFWLVNE